MAEDATNLILERLRRMDAKMDALQRDVSEIKGRVGDLEGLYSLYAGLSRRVDRIGDRLERIERRLDIVDETSDR